MSVMKCYDCKRDVDTDFHEMYVFIDKYCICGKCLDKDELYEIMDEMQTALDDKHRQCNGLTKALAEAIIDLRASHDSSKQGLKRQGLSV